MGKSIRGSAGKTNIVAEGATSMKWNDSVNRIFIQLCVEEIGKGNKPNSHFNVVGWNSLVKRFNEETGRKVVYKQLRNHWDIMKKEWVLFKKLMQSETGIGWDPSKNSLDASEEWWSKKISENADFKKFKNKDLSLVWFEYDQLFCDFAAMGEGARPLNQVYINDLENDGEADEVQEHVEIGDSDDMGIIALTGPDTSLETQDTSSVAEKDMLLSFDSVKRKYCGENSKSKKVSGAASASLEEDIRSLLHFMEKKSSATLAPPNEITIKDAMDILSNVSGIAPTSELWNYACNLLSKKDMREVFASQPSHEARLSWLEFNYDLFKKKYSKPGISNSRGWEL